MRSRNILPVGNVDQSVLRYAGVGIHISHPQNTPGTMGNRGEVNLMGVFL